MEYTCIICLVELFLISIVLAICVTTADICEDVDTTACERVKLIRPGMCSEPYISKLLTCYQCPQHIPNQRAFTNTTQCQPGYVCSIKKYLTGGLIYWASVEMGCMLEKSVQVNSNMSGGRAICKLNHNDMVKGRGKCDGSKWDFCRSHGAHLADFTTRYQLLPVIQKVIIPLSFDFLFLDPQCWIDAVYSDSQHHWIWSHSSALVEYRYFSKLAHSTGKTSKCALASYPMALTPLVFEVDVDCSQSYIPLCEVNPFNNIKLSS